MNKRDVIARVTALCQEAKEEREEKLKKLLTRQENLSSGVSVSFWNNVGGWLMQFISPILLRRVMAEAKEVLAEKGFCEIAIKGLGEGDYNPALEMLDCLENKICGEVVIYEFSTDFEFGYYNPFSQKLHDLFTLHESLTALAT